jgi:hypothetical protein
MPGQPLAAALAKAVTFANAVEIAQDHEISPDDAIRLLAHHSDLGFEARHFLHVGFAPHAATPVPHRRARVPRATRGRGLTQRAAGDFMNSRIRASWRQPTLPPARRRSTKRQSRTAFWPNVVCAIPVRRRKVSMTGRSG